MGLFSVISFLLAITVASGFRGHSTGVREYCEWERFNATCAVDEMMVIETAKYGRMALGRCVTKNYGHIGCGTDVTSDFDQICSGRPSCGIRVISLHARRSCPTGLKAYLEASYKCVKVEVPVNKSCPAGGTMLLTAREGAIASSTAFATSLGFADCPWTIRVEPHQTINLTLIDFFAPTPKTRWHGSVTEHARGTCREYLVVSEPSMNTSRSVCGGRAREAVVYVSRTNVVRLHLVNSALHGARFILHYKAVGCRPLLLAPNMYLSMAADNAVVKCNGTSQAWYLTCRDTGWIGHVGNCSPPVLAVAQDERWSLSGVFQKSSTFPFGVLIVVALGIAIGVAIGVALLVGVMTYMKRTRRRKIRSRSNYMLKQLSLLDDQEDGRGKWTGGLPERAPASLKRCCADAARQNYVSTLPMRGRPLPTPANLLPITAALTREEPPAAVSPPSCSARRASQQPTSGFSTFKPRDGATEAPYSPNRPNDGSASPFYFQLDPEASPTRHSYRPDILNAYSCRTVT